MANADMTARNLEGRGAADDRGARSLANERASRVQGIKLLGRSSGQPSDSHSKALIKQVHFD